MFTRVNIMESLLIFGIIVATVVLFIAIFWKPILKLFINSVVGLALLLILDLVFGLGIPVSNLYVILSVAVFGLPAVGTLLLLRLGGLV